MHAFFSNQVEQLFDLLKENLFDSATPFARRMIVVPSPAMKSWLMLRMAKDPSLGIAAGLEISYLDQTLDTINNLLHKNTQQSITPLTIALAIEQEIRTAIATYSNLNQIEQNIWKPLLHYLKIDLTSPYKPSRQSNRRLTALSEKLASLFIQYGKFAGTMIHEWESQKVTHWQQQIWNNLFNSKTGKGWPYPIKQFTSHLHTQLPRDDVQVHLFAMSYVSPIQHRFLTQLSTQAVIKYYVLSPCQAFWSNIVSDKETHRLQKFWKKQKVSISQQKALEELLRDNNPLLANFGRIGREMAKQIEESEAITIERYSLPSNIQENESYQSLYIDEDIIWQDNKHSLTMLQAIQTDMTLLRNPDATDKIPLQNNDNSLQIHAASSKMREVQILYNTLLQIIDQHATDSDPVIPESIVVMAPDINAYAPFIRAIFGATDSVLEAQIMDLGMPAQSPFIQAFLHLLSLPFSRWEATVILQMFEFPAFQKRHQLSNQDLNEIREWIGSAKIRWGQNAIHRDELLLRDHCQHGMVECSKQGTWDWAAQTLLNNITTNVNPLDIDSTDGPLLGKWLELLHSLNSDLKCLNDGTSLTLEEWSLYLRCLSETYLRETDGSEMHSILHAFIDHFRQVGQVLESGNYPFSTILHHLKVSLNKPQPSFRETALSSVRFCSMMPMRAIPAQVVAILGMNDGDYPRQDAALSLNQMRGKEVDYTPSQVDYDRYLFLETLLSARRYFVITYINTGEDNKERPPSLLTTELLNYIDKAYTLDNALPSEKCIHKHPFYSFDKSYFTKDCLTPSFSKQDYNAALAFYHTEKKPKTSFVSDFSIAFPPKVIPEETIHVHLKDLNSFAKNPIKTYFNKTLGIYFDNSKNQVLNNEDIAFSHLQKYALKLKSTKKSIEEIFFKAEREGLLPIGPFKTVELEKIKQEIESLKSNLSELGVREQDVFEMRFSEKFIKPSQTAEGNWNLPCLQLQVGSKNVKISGTLSEVAHQGLISDITGSKKDIIKSWPQFLTLSCLTKQFQLPCEEHLLITKGDKGISMPKFTDDPQKLLIKFLEYYFLAQENISPLIPEWTHQIMTKNGDQFSGIMRKDLENTYQPLYNDYLKWAIQEGSFPSTNTLIDNWQPLAQELYTDLFQNWFKEKNEE